MKCYNCGKKCHYDRDCLEPQKTPFSTYSPELYVCSDAFVANSLPNWIADTRASKYIVRDRVGFVDFHCYPMGSVVIFCKCTILVVILEGRPAGMCYEIRSLKFSLRD